MKKIVIVDYDPEWPEIYEIERKNLSQILGSIPHRVEHIGSTSVEGLGAKPVIDVLLGLGNFEQDKEELIKRMTASGYNYIDDFEHTMPYRRYFNKPGDGKITSYHIHSVQTGEWFWNRHIAFRDYLREHSEVRDEYCALKKELAKKDWDEKNDYAWAKTDFIVPVQEKAMKEYFEDYKP